MNAQSIEPFLQELNERTFAKYNAFTVGEVFNETDEELHFFIGKDGVFSSIFDFKQTCLGQEGKGWFDHTLQQRKNLRKVFSKRMSAQIGLVFSRPSSKTTTNLEGCPIISQKVQ